MKFLFQSDVQMIIIAINYIIMLIISFLFVCLFVFCKEYILQKITSIVKK